MMKRIIEKPEVYADCLYNLDDYLDKCYALSPLGTYRLKKKLIAHLKTEDDYIPFRANIGSAVIILKNHREIGDMLLFMELRNRQKFVC